MAFLPKDYVGVNVRIDQFHAKYEKGSIKTSFHLDGDLAVFSAEVSDGEGRVFNGHSFGKLNKEKAFEKLETVAVGRALAFMGFETRESIASREEMDLFHENEFETYCNLIKEAKNMDELQAVWLEGYKIIKPTKFFDDFEALKNEIKSKFEPKKANTPKSK